jgi:hypothetical protein
MTAQHNRPITIRGYVETLGMPELLKRLDSTSSPLNEVQTELCIKSCRG